TTVACLLALHVALPILLFACGPVLILNLLRWGNEVRDWSALNLPDEDRESTGLSDKELDMARQLVTDMSIKWEPERFTDSFRERSEEHTSELQSRENLV